MFEKLVQHAAFRIGYMILLGILAVINFMFAMAGDFDFMSLLNGGVGLFCCWTLTNMITTEIEIRNGQKEKE